MAVRYVPLLLQGSARTWLNSLPAESINSWLDFEEVFNRNFTGTYLRPGNVQLLAMCRQKDDESYRAYLTRWTGLHNSCEGIPEFQAVQYFIQGCRDQTLLRHKLLRKNPKTMAHLMAIADEYATADAGMTNPIRLDVAFAAHLQSNGQVERANGLILAGIKPRLLEPLEQAAGA